MAEWNIDARNLGGSDIHPLLLILILRGLELRSTPTHNKDLHLELACFAVEPKLKTVDEQRAEHSHVFIETGFPVALASISKRSDSIHAIMPKSMPVLTWYAASTNC